MRLVPEAEIRDEVARAIKRNSAAIEGIFPAATIDHIGATSVPGSVTKGDLDLLVAVPPDGFDEAKRRLGERYAPHYPEEWDPARASFTEQPEVDLPVGVQLVVAESDDERLFLDWRDRLRSDAGLLSEYNDLKLAHAGDDYEPYTDAKAEFIERLLGESI